MNHSAASEFADALRDPACEPPPGLRTWNGSDALDRFNVYRNNIAMSLIDALASTFAVTRQLVGTDFFRAMARIHVAESLPESPILSRYGNDFPDFISRFPHASSLPYLADVARLEYLRVQAYHAADATALTAATFQPLLADPARLAATQMTLHPACRWLRSEHPVFSLWAAHQAEGDLSHIEMSKAEDVLVIRPSFDVQVIALPPGSVEFLDALSSGESLSTAIERINRAGIEFDLSRQLAGLIEHGLVVELITP